MFVSTLMLIIRLNNSSFSSLKSVMKLSFTKGNFCILSFFLENVSLIELQ